MAIAKLTSRKIKEMIRDGRDLSRSIKDKEQRLNDIKETLKEQLAEGTHIGDDNSVLVLSSSTRGEVKPQDVLDYLKKERKVTLFMDCISVIAKKAEIVLGKEVFATFKKVGTSFLTASFK